MTSIHNILPNIQGNLNAPKNQRNDFGKYNYRKAEDIIAAFKALDTGAGLTLTDDVVAVGNKIFLKATATLTIGDESVSVSGWAMHADTKKGMDEAQITGSCSSYARKYALCGLFAIDDSDHDPDGKDNREPKSTPKDPTPKASDDEANTAIDLINSKSTTDDLIKYWKSLNENAMHVAADPRVIKAKDMRKTELENV